MSDSTFHWGLIDHHLVGLKLTDLAEEMHESIQAELGQIQFDNLGNSNSQAVPALTIAMHLRRTDDWIEKSYNAYCEVWAKQGHQKTPNFIRAVSSHAIPTIISARTNAVVAGLSDQCARTGSPTAPHNARMESFKRSMNRLAARWTRKLEIEARECEHSERSGGNKKSGGFDQRENLRRAIIGRRAEIERINRALDNLPTPGKLSPYGQPIRVSQHSIANLIQRRQEHEAGLVELEAKHARMARPTEPMGKDQERDQEQLSADTLAPVQTGRNRGPILGADLPPSAKGDSPPPPVEVREVSPGVGLPLVDLTKSASTIAKETRRAAMEKGAPYREVPDMARIRKALEYKKNTGCTYPEASIKEFGDRDSADRIRYWHNRLASGEQ